MPRPSVGWIRAADSPALGKRKSEAARTPLSDITNAAQDMPPRPSPPATIDAAHSASPAPQLFPWQANLEERMARYRQWADIPSPVQRASPRRTPDRRAPASTPTPASSASPSSSLLSSSSPSSAARLQCGPDRFAHVEQVWRGAVSDTPRRAPPAKRARRDQSRQLTLDAFTAQPTPPIPTRAANGGACASPGRRRSASPGRRRSASPPQPAACAAAPSASPPSPCSSVPGGTDDELPSPARAWIRSMGSSPSHWLAEADL